MKNKTYSNSSLHLDNYFTNPGQIIQQLGFGFDFTKSEYETPVKYKEATFSLSLSGFWAVINFLKIVIYQPLFTIYNAFKIVLTSPVK